MADFSLREAEGCGPARSLLWDTVWDVEQGCGNWALTPPGDTTNQGGLVAKAALEAYAKATENDDPRGHLAGTDGRA